jgi:glycosyltransferase involved in cell wall biosynthesis
MKIGIDARLIDETGVGRYIRNLLTQLKELDTENEYVIYLPKNGSSDFTLPNKRWEKKYVSVRWHTLLEQLVLPFIFAQDKLDVLHVPYFNVPIFYFGTCIVTIHDLIILHVMTGKATTLPYPIYILRKIGYYMILAIGLRKASSILVPSNTTKQEIVDHFHIPEKKIHVTYEGVDERLRTVSRQLSAVRQLRKPYFLYIGNAYPHKNLERLVQAFADFCVKQKSIQYQLVMVGKNDFFYNKLKVYIKTLGIEKQVEILHSVSDEELNSLYKNSIGLVFPSLMEGFGLPALEAIALGVPVMVSNIPIFHEILGEIPLYVDPLDVHSMSEGLVKLTTGKCKGKKDAQSQLLNSYSWRSLGIQTLKQYTLSIKK